MRYILIYIRVLYIAINICRITDDKYSLVCNIRGSANFASLLFFGGQRAQTLWEQETLFMGHVTKTVTPAAWVTPHPQFPFLNLPLSDPGPEGRGLGGRRPPQSSGGRGLAGRHS